MIIDTKYNETGSSLSKHVWALKDEQIGYSIQWERASESQRVPEHYQKV